MAFSTFMVLVQPAPLFPRRWEHLAQGGPESEGAIADRRLRILLQAATPEVAPYLAPAPGAFAKAVGHGQQLLAPVFVCAHDHQSALFFLSHPRLEGDAVGPDAEKPPGAEVALFPNLVFGPPVRLQPRDRRGRQALGVQPRQRRQCLAEITRGQAFQVKPREHLLDRPCLAQIPRQDAGRERNPVSTRLAITDTRHRQGRRLSHTMDPRRGAPLIAPPASVTVVARTCAKADAWATAVMTLGPDKGATLAKRSGLDAQFLLRDDDASARGVGVGQLFSEEPATIAPADGR